jgi:predicted Zn finger-like uncharacterized protein
MNVQCTHCNTVFRVDPARVPAGGVRARCSICRGVFDVAPQDGAAPAAAPAPAPPPPAPEPEPQPATAPEVRAEAAPAPSRPEAPAAPPPAPPATAAATPPAAAPRGGGSPFGASDPGAKARRLARALVSDIVTYHPERRDRALAEGTLKREFMEEIKKSWEEFVGQVGADTARGTPHFRDALNDILAKGQSVF